MKRLFRNPFHLLLLPVLVFAVLSLFNSSRTFDIHLHDTYFILAYPHFYLGAALVLLASWMLNVAVRRIAKFKALTWIH
ncbi:MAG: hypothetical protein EOP09_05155, partial [Proteobacteria bacterium]